MERIGFLKFRNEFTKRSLLSITEVSLFAPIIYRFEDKYFNACYEYLQFGKESNLVFGEYSVLQVKEAMKCSYVEALVILHNMEQFPNEACYIYSPKIIE